MTKCDSFIPVRCNYLVPCMPWIEFQQHISEIAHFNLCEFVNLEMPNVVSVKGKILELEIPCSLTGSTGIVTTFMGWKHQGMLLISLDRSNHIGTNVNLFHSSIQTGCLIWLIWFSQDKAEAKRDQSPPCGEQSRRSGAHRCMLKCDLH